MRHRLAFTMVGLSLLIVSVVFIVGRTMLADAVRAGELATLEELALHTAGVVDQQYATGGDVTQEWLDHLTSSQTRLTVSRAGQPEVTILGESFEAGALGTTLVAARTMGSTTVTLVHGDQRVRAIASRVSFVLLVLMGFAALAAGMLAWAVARGFSRPFAELATSAEALGRGRFDIELPDSRVPEVVALGAALRSSADHLEHHFLRNREVVQRTSHALRTPLTGMRLELEEVLLRDDLAPDVRSTVTRCLADALRLDATVADLVAAERGRGPTGGGSAPLSALTSAVVERWQRRLPTSRKVSMRVGDGGDLPVTPGPVEQVLDRVLADLCAHGAGPVELIAEAEESHVRIRVRGQRRKDVELHALDRVDLSAGETVTHALGGHWDGDALAGGLEILLPRR